VINATLVQNDEGNVATGAVSAVPDADWWPDQEQSAAGRVNVSAVGGTNRPG